MVKATAAYLISQRKPYLIPVLGMRSASKLLGYRLGRSYQKLPENIVLHLTGNKSYWEKKKKLQSRCKNKAILSHFEHKRLLYFHTIQKKCGLTEKSDAKLR